MATAKLHITKIHGNLDHADCEVRLNGNTVKSFRVSREEFRDLDAVDFSEFIEFSLAVMKRRRVDESTPAELTSLTPEITI